MTVGSVLDLLPTAVVPVVAQAAGILVVPSLGVLFVLVDRGMVSGGEDVAARSAR